MKILLLAIVLSAAVTAVSSADSAYEPTTKLFTENLTVGSKGPEVKNLQTCLEANGFGPIAQTGYFGPQTRGGVAKYQAANGIWPTSGFLGPITRAHMNAHIVATTKAK